MAPSPPFPIIEVPNAVVKPSPASSPAPFPSQKSSVNECKERLKELGMKEARKTMVSKTTPAKFGTEARIQTNVFGMQVNKNTIIHSYLVHAEVDIGPAKTAIFTKKGNEDFVVLDRHEKCIEIFFAAVKKNPSFFKLAEKNQIIYDGQSLLFTTCDLFPEFKHKADKKRLFVLNGEDTDNEDLKPLMSIRLEVFVGDRHRINFSRENLIERTADSDLDLNDRSLTTLLELIMNQQCIRDPKRFACFEHGKVYIVNPMAEGFAPMDTKPVGDGKYLLPGLKKTIQFIEGPFGPGHNNPSLVVDSKKAAFHREETVSDKIEDIINPKTGRNGPQQADVNRLLSNYEKITPIIKGLDVYSTYTGRTRHFKVDAVHHQNAVTAMFDLGDGNKTSVMDYFLQKYNIPLKYPSLNLLVCKDRGNKNFFPMELMTVSPKQRVTISQQTSQQSQATTKECAVSPFDRQRLIMAALRSISILPEADHRNELLHAMGLLIDKNPVLVPGRALGGNVLTYGGGRSVNANKGQWRSMNNFRKPGKAPAIWALYAVNGSTRQGINDSQVHQFAERFATEAGKKGLKFPSVADAKVIRHEDVEEQINVAAQHRCEFILMVTDNSILDLHTLYKMLERNLNVTIQDITSKSFFGVLQQNKFRTLENIINKTNMKFGGLNYAVLDPSITEDQLIVGVGQSLPTPVTAQIKIGRGFLSPTVIGYSSNVRNSQEFVGDFTLSAVHQETMAPMEEIIGNLLKIWKEKRDKPLKRIVLYRTAASDGSFGDVLSSEIPLIRSVIEAYNKETKLIYIMVSKEHSFRFFKDDGEGSNESEAGTTITNRSTTSTLENEDPNIPAGILIDTEITHPTYKQFFLNSHKTLQGTAKTPMYTILVDDCNASMERLEALSFTLCHHHQIVSLTTSLPAPLYIANEYAKRGRSLWTLKTNGQPVPSDGDDRQLLTDMTRQLGYQGTRFADLRINA